MPSNVVPIKIVLIFFIAYNSITNYLFVTKRMQLSEFDYKLPPELIAQFPPKRRGTTRLLVVHRNSSKFEHAKYSDICQYIRPGDVVVLNKTKVLRARIYPTVLRTGKKVEVLFLKREIRHDWYCLIGRAKDVRIGDKLMISNHEITVKERPESSPGFVVECPNAERVMDEFGHVPLPPYIKRDDTPADRSRYNTIFGDIKGSVAAPTASLNMTRTLLRKIRQSGAHIAYVNLEVSWGTFAPVNTEKIEDFKIHAERFKVSSRTAEIINKAKSSGGRIWAIGTTVVRTLETAGKSGKIRPTEGDTSLFIYPGYKFKVVDVMVTNFHVPKSSLLMLVSAFAGLRTMKKAYSEGIEKKYRFLSYGDSMLIE